MFTLFSKLCFIISLCAIVFIGGMVFASSSGSVAKDIVSIQSFLPGHKTIKADARNKFTQNRNTTRSATSKAPLKNYSAKARNSRHNSRPAAYRAPTQSNRPLGKLTSSPWITVSTGLGACSMKPEAHWSFSKKQKNSGFQCVRKSAVNGRPVYRCGTKNSVRRKDYIIKAGNALLGNATSSDRPHITLERVNRPSQTIGLKQCLASDKVWSPNTNLEPDSKKSG